MASKRIEVEEENRKAVQEKRVVAADSLQKFQLEILELDNNTEVAGELGPLQYLSGLTGTPMDKIINILLLIIIFVFDPLAIALVVAANFAFDQAYKRNLYGELEDEPKPDLWSEQDDDDEIDPPNDALVNAAERYKEEVEAPIVEKKQKGDFSEKNNEGWITLDENDKPIDHKKPVKVLQKSPSSRRIEFSDGSIEWVDRKDIDDDSLTIKYM
jgi:hypothetical protein